MATVAAPAPSPSNNITSQVPPPLETVTSPFTPPSTSCLPRAPLPTFPLPPSLPPQSGVPLNPNVSVPSWKRLFNCPSCPPDYIAALLATVVFTGMALPIARKQAPFHWYPKFTTLWIANVLVRSLIWTVYTSSVQGCNPDYVLSRRSIALLDPIGLIILSGFLLNAFPSLNTATVTLVALEIFSLVLHGANAFAQKPIQSISP